MVTLKNIKKKNDMISADYYLEGNEKKGFMEMRLSDKKIIRHEKTEGIVYGLSHVQYELERLAKLDNPPSEKKVIWY